ncbi:hypothetical protein GQR36_00785 [Enterococcus termitis]
MGTLPIIFSFIAAVVLSWRINQLDVQSNHQTLASTATQSTLGKIMARYVLSYVQVVVIGAINLVFNFTIVSLSLIQLLFIALELAVYLAGMVSYLILLRGVVAKLWLPNVSKTSLLRLVGS